MLLYGYIQKEKSETLSPGHIFHAWLRQVSANYIIRYVCNYTFSHYLKTLRRQTLWCRVTHIGVSKLTTLLQIMACRLFGGNPLSEPMLNETLLIGPLGQILSRILIEIYIFSFKKMHLKISANWRPFCVGPNMLKIENRPLLRHFNVFC